MTESASVIRYALPVVASEASMLTVSRLRVFDSSVNGEVCRVSRDGRVMRDGVDITDNPQAMARCFVDLLRVVHGVTVDV